MRKSFRSWLPRGWLAFGTLLAIRGVDCGGGQEEPLAGASACFSPSGTGTGCGSVAPSPPGLSFCQGLVGGCVASNEAACEQQICGSCTLADGNLLEQVRDAGVAGCPAASCSVEWLLCLSKEGPAVLSPGCAAVFATALHRSANDGACEAVRTEADGGGFCSVIGPCVGGVDRCKQSVCESCDAVDGIVLEGEPPEGFFGGDCSRFDAVDSCGGMACFLEAAPLILSPGCAAALSSLASSFLTVCDGGALANTQSDDWNCGSCGQVCAVAPPSTANCTDGECLATLAIETGSFNAVAVNERAVYWTTPVQGPAYISDGVMAVPLGGGDVTTIFPGGYPQGLAANGFDVCWGDWDTGGIFASFDGGAAREIVAGQWYPQAVALDRTNVYWVSAAGVGVGPTGAVLRAPLTGEVPVTLAPAGDPQGIAIDSTHVYWTDVVADGGAVMKVQLGGGGLATLASNLWVSSSIVVGPARVYWVGEGQLLSVQLDGGGLTTLVASTVSSDSLAIDSASIYWVDGDGEVLMQAPLDGGAAVAVPWGPVSISAVDSTSVYMLGWQSPVPGTEISYKVTKITPK